LCLFQPVKTGNFFKLSSRANTARFIANTPLAFLFPPFKWYKGIPMSVNKLTDSDNINVFGGPFEPNVVDQIKTAASLPVFVKGALMPDAHLGYSLPIGGVVDLQDAISPAFVGYDIACRMCFTAFDLDHEALMRDRAELAKILRQCTSFGLGAHGVGDHLAHPVISDPRWDAHPFIRGLKPLAAKQLGTSGSGNHFADLVTIMRIGEQYPNYTIGLITHSGSRGVGYKFAQHYMRIADAARAPSIPKGYGYLSPDKTPRAYQEYIDGMQLMGAYASANHAIIHRLFTQISGLQVVDRIENHHNYAWKVGDLWRHRKGATPADLAVRGIIPGSSGTPSYLVRGLGNPESLMSAAHGAGRTMSRTQAKKQFDGVRFQERMRDILHFGVDKDESYLAYKDIAEVMRAQGECVQPTHIMHPVVVIMGGRSSSRKSN
jgi:tRNA-splicing ligase RtcB (3'-phosphate/5'-hydroxy nucleic acid ligase)